MPEENMCCTCAIRRECKDRATDGNATLMCSKFIPDECAINETNIWICNDCAHSLNCKIRESHQYNSPITYCASFLKDNPIEEMVIGRVKNLVNAIADSGNRREFDTGAVRDIQEGKGRMDLLPWAAIMEISKHCENGAKKYGEHNVDKGIPTNSLCDSAARHLAKYLDGWEDEPHLLAAAWNLLWAIEMTIKHPEVVNTPYKEE